MSRDSWFIIPHQGIHTIKFLKKKKNLFQDMGTEIHLLVLQSEMHNSPETRAWYIPFYSKGDPGQAALQTSAVTVRQIPAKIHEFLNSRAMEFPGLLKVISIHVSVFWWLRKCSCIFIWLWISVQIQRAEWIHQITPMMSWRVEKHWVYYLGMW